MKKIKYFMITGMILASIGLAGCGKKAEDDITNKEIFEDDLEPLTEEELDEMDADDSDEDMKQIDEPDDELQTVQTLQMQQKPQIKLIHLNLLIKLSLQILWIQQNQRPDQKLQNNCEYFMDQEVI